MKKHEPLTENEKMLIIVKSQIVTSRKGCYMARSKENTEIVPVTIQANDIGNLIYTIRDKQVMLDP